MTSIRVEPRIYSVSCLMQETEFFYSIRKALATLKRESAVPIE